LHNVYCTSCHFALTVFYRENKHEELVFRLELCIDEKLDMDVRGVDIVIQQDLATHLGLFGRNGIRHIGPSPLRKIIHSINNAGDIMVKQREEMIDILVNVDKEENPDTEDGEAITRINEKIKLNLESSADLTQWLEGTRKKFKKLKFNVYKSVCILGSTGIFGGLVTYVGDIGTDSYFTHAMKSLYESSLANKTSNCSAVLEERMEWKVFKACRQASASFNPLNCSNQLDLAVQDSNCLMSEENRFLNPDTFLQISNFSLMAIILPLIVLILCGVTFAYQRKKWWTVFIFFPPVAKLVGFIAESKLQRCLGEPKSKENEEKIQGLKQEIEEQQEIINLGMEIEANVESSFQFSFQMLYSLPILVLMYSKSQAQSSSILNKFLTEKTLSILLSFISIGYSFVNIREESCVFLFYLCLGAEEWSKLNFNVR
jgi:hypothetical protein